MITVENLVKSYKSVRVLRGISHTQERGEAVVLYRVRKWTGGQAVRYFDGGKQVSVSMNVRELFV